MKIICTKDYIENGDLFFIKNKEYSSYNYENLLILSGVERIEREPELCAISFSKERFREYFISYEQYIRKQKLEKLKILG
jgi:hypothetical protein